MLSNFLYVVLLDLSRWPKWQNSCTQHAHKPKSHVTPWFVFLLKYEVNLFLPWLMLGMAVISCSTCIAWCLSHVMRGVWRCWIMTRSRHASWSGFDNVAKGNRWLTLPRAQTACLWTSLQCLFALARVASSLCTCRSHRMSHSSTTGTSSELAFWVIKGLNATLFFIMFFLRLWNLHIFASSSDRKSIIYGSVTYHCNTGLTFALVAY